MRVISVWQPWATMLGLDEKAHETRGWATKHRGLLAIHAAKVRINLSNGQDIGRDALALVQDILGVQWHQTVPYGAIIAVTTLADCLSTTTTQPRDIGDLWLGNWEPGRFAWKLTDTVVLKKPVPVRGHQRMWTLTPEQDAAVRAQM